MPDLFPAWFIAPFSPPTVPPTVPSTALEVVRIVGWIDSASQGHQPLFFILILMVYYTLGDPRFSFLTFFSSFSYLRVHRAVEADDRNKSQPVPPSALEIIRVVRRGDLLQHSQPGVTRASTENETEVGRGAGGGV